MGSERQRKGRVLEEAVYRKLIKVLQQRMNTDGQEGHTDYGMVWVGHETLFLFWNSQVRPHPHTDPYGQEILNRREPDLVLCHRVWTKSTVRDSYDWALLPIMAVETKNTNLNYRWPNSYLFDRDVMRRFLRVSTYYIPKLLSMDNWRESARNLFPDAIKILVQPAFGFTGKAEVVPHSRRTMTKEELTLFHQRQNAGLIPASGSQRDKILWRINRLGLIVYQTGYQLPIGEKLPKEIEVKLSTALTRWLKQSLQQNFRQTELPQSIPLPAYYDRADAIRLRGEHHNIWTYLIQNSEFPQFQTQRPREYPPPRSTRNLHRRYSSIPS